MSAGELEEGRTAAKLWLRARSYGSKRVTRAITYINVLDGREEGGEGLAEKMAGTDEHGARREDVVGFLEGGGRRGVTKGICTT